MFEVDPVELRFDDVRELPAHPLSSVPRLHVRKSLSSLSRSLLGALIGSSPMLALSDTTAFCAALITAPASTRLRRSSPRRIQLDRCPAAARSADLAGAV
jgi:hypothetical protein